MARDRNTFGRAALFGGAALWALTAMMGSASAEITYNIAPKPLTDALNELGHQSQLGVVFTPDLTATKTANGVVNAKDPETALRQMLAGSGLSFKRSGDSFLIVKVEAPRISPAYLFAPAETVSGSAIEGLVVTAQKRREAIQDVPIAISAFSADTLQAQKIEGGFDLLKAIPNVTFSKNNFSAYNFSIRGIGTKAISVATDPGVAVEFNDTPLIRNRLFEQEYFDVERVEVLRGPQGTLHGRNATAGVINVISNTADLDAFSGQLKGEVGNYHTKRLSGFVNVPLIEDVLAVRFAGALTNREGYDYNDVTEMPVNGRDLWSGRLSIGFEPTERLRANFIWERFNEDDDRSRTGKQLCHRDPGPSEINGVTINDPTTSGLMSQGCLPGSLYSKDALSAPNGLSMPFVLFTSSVTFPSLTTVFLPRRDPYLGLEQAQDLRTISSIRNPIYRANTDVLEFNVSYDLTDDLTLTALTAYVKDEVYSFQDYNRFNSNPIFRPTSAGSEVYPGQINFGTWDNYAGLDWTNLAPNGVFTDPQLGPSDRLVGFDISQASSEQFSQEFRVQSSFAGPLNFSAGVNYTRYTTLEDYYVFYNLLTLAAIGLHSSPDMTECRSLLCPYIDPNPIESLDREGHNYYLSQNPYRLQSAAAFGELYWNATDALKVTAGLRYTDDKKTFTPIPSQVLLDDSVILGGTVDKGYPHLPDIKQHWKEISGRLGVDWKVSSSFTDDTLLYAFYSRGYKGGGANPPSIGFDKTPFAPGFPPRVWSQSSYGETFRPEFVDAFEVGAKNTLLGGGLVMNFGAFFYDYKDYQVSKIVERTAANENFDAKVWGLEFESILSPTPDLRVNASIGYQGSEIADGSKSIDLMDRLQGHGDDYTILKAFVLLPSNCVAPKDVIAQIIAYNQVETRPDLEARGLTQLCPGSLFGFAGGLVGQPVPGLDITADMFPNGGQGFYADVSGNELPNTPHWTISLGAQQTWRPFSDWEFTVRGDYYRQSDSYARIYNTEYDKLRAWENVNLSAWIEKPEANLKIELYVKNLLDEIPITDAFLNSDDTALTTNIFTLDPRLIGLQITKGF